MFRSARCTRTANVNAAFVSLVFLFALVLLPARSAADAPVPQFLESWPCTGCRGVAVVPGGDVFAIAPTEVRHFTSEGTYVGSWPLPLAGPEDRADAYGIAADPFGHLFVSNYAAHRLTKFTTDGTVVLEVGTPGTAPGQIWEPLAVACDAQGNVYLGNVNGDIDKFSGTGAHLMRLASHGWGDGEFITVLGIAISPTGTVFATDWINCIVEALSPSGTFLYRLGSPETGDICGLQGLALDASGIVYVSEASGRIWMYHATGAYIGRFETPGSGAGQLGQPFGLAVDQQGRLLVADDRNGRIQVFGYPVVPARTNTWGGIKTGAR